MQTSEKGRRTPAMGRNLQFDNLSSTKEFVNQSEGKLPLQGI